jgi:RHS repeat-associated protein
LTNRYVHNPQVVDMILADEQFDPALEIGVGSTEGDTLWPLTDHLGSVRDIADNDGDIVNHLTYDAFGQITSETTSAIDHIFAFTGRDRDEESHLQFNLARYYDAAVGRWLSEDPIGFVAGDTNISRYASNNPTNLTDPMGLKWQSGIATILGKSWTKETAERAGESLAKEFLEKLARYRPDEQKAQEIIRQLKGLGWVEEKLGQGGHAGQGLILREKVDGKLTDTFLQWHPGGGHHGPDPYWKFSSGQSGTLRTVGGAVAAVAIATIPGAAYASERDFSGAGRDVVIEATPLRWAKALWQSLGSFFDSCERDVLGNDYHERMEQVRKEYWEKRGL